MSNGGDRKIRGDRMVGMGVKTGVRSSLFFMLMEDKKRGKKIKGVSGL